MPIKLKLYIVVISLVLLSFNGQVVLASEDACPSGYTGKVDGALSEGGKYKGGCLNGNRHGKGILRLADGTVISGNWENDKLNGKCVLEFADGDGYIGDCIDSKRHGKGIFTWEGVVKGIESTYTGDWVDGKKHGKGTYTWDNGDMYEGDFKDDVRAGIGSMHWANGSKYSGEWVKDVMQGKGTKTWSDGSVYTGDWENNKAMDAPTMLQLKDWFLNLTWDAMVWRVVLAALMYAVIAFFFYSCLVDLWSEGFITYHPIFGIPLILLIGIPLILLILAVVYFTWFPLFDGVVERNIDGGCVIFNGTLVMFIFLLDKEINKKQKKLIKSKRNKKSKR